MGKYQVKDRNGNIIELEDGTPVPDGCRLSTPIYLMDSLQKNIRDSVAVITDGSANPDPYFLNRPGHRQIANDAARSEVMKSYYDGVAAMSNAWRHDATTESKTEGGACDINGKPGKWQSSPTGFICIPDGASDSAQRGAADAADPRRQAYLASVSDAESAWRR